MKGKILIVDDEPQIRRVMRTALTPEGYLTVDAKSAEEAFDKFREERFDLILLDVNMPGLNGLKACAEFRRTSDIAIIMLTVCNADADKVAALDAGADDYVTKPFSMPELLARVRSCLRRVPYLASNGPAVISFGAWKLILKAGMFQWAGGTCVSLQKNSTFCTTWLPTRM